MKDAHRIGNQIRFTVRLTDPVQELMNDLTRPIGSVVPVLRTAPELISTYLDRSLSAAVVSPAWWNHGSQTQYATIQAFSVQGIEPLKNVLDKLIVLFELPNDWDSYGAARTSPQAAVIAVALVLILWHAGLVPESEGFDIFPVPTGGIQLEWSGRNGEIEIEIDPVGSIRSLIDWKDGPYEELPEGISLSPKDISDQVRRVVS